MDHRHYYVKQKLDGIHPASLKNEPVFAMGGGNTSELANKKVRKFFYEITLYLVGAIILFLISYLKTNSLEYFFQSPILFIYTLFVTIFRISRVWAAMFYKMVDNKILEAYSDPEYEPKVTFVVPCKNEETAIGKTVEKCFAADYPKSKIEVIVINDGSTDGTAAVLKDKQKKFSHLKVINWKVNKGKRHGMAAGFKHANGEIIIQLDSDSYILPNTLRNLVRYFTNPKIGAVCAHAYIENSDENLLTKMQAAHYFAAFRISKAAESTFASVFCCSGCSSAYRKSMVLPIIDKWLNEKFMGLPVTWGDDRALTNWVLKCGHQTIYTEDAKSFTIAPAKWSQFIKQQIRWKKGWFVNSCIASRFIFRREPYVALTYFLPLTLTTFISPFIAVKIFLWDAVIMGKSPMYYIIGATLVNLVVLVYYKILSPRDKYWLYTFVWAFVNMFFMTYVLFYALLTIQNRKWGTR